MPEQQSSNRPWLTSRVPLLDVSRQNGPLANEIANAIANVCESGKFVLGPACTELETRVAEYCDASHAVGCGSGTDALLLALMALDIGRGDEVIVPSFTFFATASAVWRLGATPVFADIDAKTFNICPHQIEKRITPATRAIIPVHLFGRPAAMDQIMTIARDHRLFVIEDAAQSLGAEYRGTKVGNIGDIGCTSFYPTKNLGGFGDGGMMITSNDDLAKRLKVLRQHGMNPRYYHREVGINSRLDSLQAAVLNVKLQHLPAWTEKRIENARRYAKLFEAANLTDTVVLPHEAEDERHVWNQYTIRIPNGKRDALRQHLADHGIGSEIYYPVPLHRQECFASLETDRSLLAETEIASTEVLSLPIFPELTADEQRTVVARITEFFASEASRVAA